MCHGSVPVCFVETLLGSSDDRYLLHVGVSANVNTGTLRFVGDFLLSGYRDNFWSLLMATPSNPTGPLNPPFFKNYPSEAAWFSVSHYDWSLGVRQRRHDLQLCTVHLLVLSWYVLQGVYPALDLDFTVDTGSSSVFSVNQVREAFLHVSEYISVHVLA